MQNKDLPENIDEVTVAVEAKLQKLSEQIANTKIKLASSPTPTQLACKEKLQVQDFHFTDEKREQENAEQEAEKQKKDRDMLITQRSAGFTELVKAFVESYKAKQGQNQKLKKQFFWIIMILFIVTLGIPLIIILFTACGWIDGLEVVSISLTSLCSIIASIIVIPKIIAQYLFSLKEDEAVLDICKEFYKQDNNFKP